MPAWIDFKSLRQHLNFEQVLRHYGVEIKRKGDQHHGFCPLPGHNAKKNSPSFSANLKKGIFQCFGCQSSGNILDFAALMSKVDPENGAALREVALDLQQRFCPELKSGKSPPRPQSKPERSEPTQLAAAIVNATLDFELKGLDQNHPYLLGRGFSPETIAHFGLGFCSRGLLQNRIAIPLHGQKANLIGYAGRVVDDKAITEDNPRYRFPSRRERDGKVFEFRKSVFLYNGFRIAAPVDDLVVVESFTAVWWLSQHGHANVVATMGADCSERQAVLIVGLAKPNGRVWILSDGDEPGRRLAESLLKQLSSSRFVRWVKLEPDTQPTDLSGEQLKASLCV